MINIDDRVLDALNESEVYLCLQISRYMKSNRMTAWPSIETLAARCKWDERTVKRWRNSLEQKGFLEVKQTPGKAPTYRFKKAGFGVFHAMEETPAQAENGGARNEGGTFYEGGQNMYLGGVQNMHPHPPQNLYPEVISKEVIKKLEVVREEERVAAPPPPSLKDVFPFSEPKKENTPPVPPPPPNSGPAWPAASDPYAWPDAVPPGVWIDESGPVPADYTSPRTRSLEIHTFAPPEIVYETLSDGDTLRAEVHPPAQRQVVKPKAAKPRPQPRAVEIPETHRQISPLLNDLLSKKPYLQKSDDALRREMAWLFSKPVKFCAEHIQNSLDRSSGVWDSLKFSGCEETFLRWERTQARAAAPVQPAQNPSGPQPTPTRLTPSTVHTRHRTMADFL